MGEMVRYWHLPKSAKGNAAKLELRNGVYEVVKRDNNRYDIRHVNYPEIELKNVDVSYLARWRGEAPQIKDLFASTAQPVRKNMTDAFNAGSQAITELHKGSIDYRRPTRYTHWLSGFVTGHLFKWACLCVTKLRGCAAL